MVSLDAWNGQGEYGEFWWRIWYVLGTFLAVCIGDSGVNKSRAGPEVEHVIGSGRANLSTYTRGEYWL